MWLDVLKLEAFDVSAVSDTKLTLFSSSKSRLPPGHVYRCEGFVEGGKEYDFEARKREFLTREVWSRCGDAQTPKFLDMLQACNESDVALETRLVSCDEADHLNESDGEGAVTTTSRGAKERSLKKQKKSSRSEKRKAATALLRPVRWPPLLLLPEVASFDILDDATWTKESVEWNAT